MILSVEVRTNGQWVPAGQIEPGQPPGSMSDNHDDGSRDVYIFGLLGNADRACVWRSLLGVDSEIGAARLVTTARVEVVAELNEPGATYELDLRTDVSPAPRHIRFVLRAEKGRD